jgi:class 3 adenylate cyclase
MPEAVARRYKQGDETIAEDHQDVTVLFADIAGFDEYSARLDSSVEIAALNELVRRFDEAADRFGVEHVRTTRQEGYLASCGLIVPRVDHARRVVELAIEMQHILDVFSAQHDTKLQLRAGIDTGTVTSGLVGRSSIVYDMWGDTVSLAHRVHASGSAGIFLTQRVVDKLPDASGLHESGTVDTQSGQQRVWSIDTVDARV